MPEITPLPGAVKLYVGYNLSGDRADNLEVTMDFVEVVEPHKYRAAREGSGA